MWPAGTGAKAGELGHTPGAGPSVPGSRRDKMPSVYIPPSLRHFEPRRVIPGPGSRHIALEYDLVAATRPRLVVDAGAGDAVPFFTYCQSMKDHDVDGSAYAIEDWDPAAEPAHPEAALTAIEAHGRKFYPGIYYLMRIPPEPAFFHFGEGTIDLLRLDGPRFGDPAVLEPWLGRVRPGGVIVFAGAAHPSAAPGWARVAGVGQSCLFSDGRGLGLCLTPGGAGEELPDLLRLALVEGQLPALESFYSHAREHHQLRRAVGRLL